ncbi:hypothetical protein FRC14_002868 [Serendipita sp. 396]|nr:hypothetical protein FRC14_002868 [Serendipita sp. 396]
MHCRFAQVRRRTTNHTELDPYNERRIYTRVSSQSFGGHMSSLVFGALTTSTAKSGLAGGTPHSADATIREDDGYYDTSSRTVSLPLASVPSGFHRGSSGRGSTVG